MTTQTTGTSALAPRLGKRLRELREERGLSRREAAEASALSESFLRLVEAGRSEIALSRLVKLVDVYATTLAEVLTQLDEEPPGVWAPLKAARSLDADNGRVKVIYLKAPRGFGQPFRLVLHPNGQIPAVAHGDREYFHVVRGRPTIVIAGEPYELAPGDTVFIPPYAEHRWVNGDREALLVGTVFHPT